LQASVTWSVVDKLLHVLGAPRSVAMAAHAVRTLVSMVLAIVARSAAD
jgi:hypothetical protein